MGNHAGRPALHIPNPRLLSKGTCNVSTIGGRERYVNIDALGANWLSLFRQLLYIDSRPMPGLGGSKRDPMPIRKPASEPIPHRFLSQNLRLAWTDGDCNQSAEVIFC